MASQAPNYHGYRFPPEIISHAVWLYHRFGLSFRDVEDLLAQRGITVTYETIRQWCGRFGPVYARTLRRRRARMGDTWYLDELFVNIQGRQLYLWRAVDEDRDEIDILVAVAAQSASGHPILSQSVERARLRTPPAGHRQAAQLPGGPPDRDAVCDPRHGPVREQSRGGLPPTDPATRAPDAALQVRRPSTTLRVGARTDAESLSGRPPPLAGRPPAALTNAGLRCLAGGDVCLNRRDGSSPHRRWSLSV